MSGKVWALTGVVGDGRRRLVGGRLALRGQLERGELADRVVDVAALRRSFAEWREVHRPAPYADAVEEEHRFRAWLGNLERVRAHNAGDHSYTLGMNAFADLSPEEFVRGVVGTAKISPRRAEPTADGTTATSVVAALLPPAVDWRANGAVTEVKNQAQCGSCWAFATTGAVEGVNAIYSGELVSLSEQELLDCDRENEFGCEGGNIDFAFEWIVSNSGITTEADYAYLAVDEACDVETRDRDHVVTIDGLRDVPAGDETALQAALAEQPVAVAIQANQMEFQLYQGGVFDNPVCGSSLDHGVLAVGYGKDESTGALYWLVKNSWGPAWGEDGYIRIARNVPGRPDGLCGIALAATRPLKTSPNPPTPPPSPDPPGPPGPPGPPKPPAPPGPTPPPGPAPVQCDVVRSCPPNTTCCCLKEISDICLQFACCPYPEATCCADGQHCCPSSHPVCGETQCNAGDGTSHGFGLKIPLV